MKKIVCLIFAAAFISSVAFGQQNNDVINVLKEAEATAKQLAAKVFTPPSPPEEKKEPKVVTPPPPPEEKKEPKVVTPPEEKKDEKPKTCDDKCKRKTEALE